MSSELCRAMCHAAAGVCAGNGSAVRMYQRGGLGDCFLLALRADDGDARYILIDCGILSSNAEAVDRIQKVAQSIAEATGGHLHVFVATHEHWDHVSGLHHARSVFDKLGYQRDSRVNIR